VIHRAGVLQAKANRVSRFQETVAFAESSQGMKALAGTPRSGEEIPSTPEARKFSAVHRGSRRRRPSLTT